MASFRRDAGTVANPRTFPARTLGERLARARERTFVGRAAELELFGSALDGRGSVSVMYLYGPGGTGKTTLLGEFAKMAAGRGVRYALLDGRSLEPSPSGFLGALRAAAERDGAQPDVDLRLEPTAISERPSDRTLGVRRASAPAAVPGIAMLAAILIDTYEELTALDIWLRAEFLVQLPAGTVVVIAGRTPPGPGWRSDPGLGEVCRVVPLRNLSPEESRHYLTRRGIPNARHDEAIASTYGHPLALALLADAFGQHAPGGSADLSRHPDVICALVERFLATAPGPRHRAALEVCAHARVTTEALLADLLGGEDVRELFDWLRSLSFIEQGEEGLLPHDVAREVLEADLRWRNPDRFRQLHRDVRRHVLRRFQESRGLAQQRAAYDKIFIHRNSPLMKPYFDWSALGSMYVDAAAPADHTAILAMVRHHEGDPSAEIAAYWLDRQPSAFQVYRSSSGPPLGFMAHLLLPTPAQQEMAVDPALAAISRWLDHAGPLRESERILVHRFWMGQQRYQDALTQSIIAASAKLLWLTTPHLACSFPCTADPSHWIPMFAYVNFDRVSEADFEVAGRRYGVFAHDWRREPVPVWLDILAERELDADLTVGRLTVSATPQVLVLSEPDFARAVRDALRDYANLDALAANPLARSRMVVENNRHSTAASALQALLRQGVEMLKGSARDEKRYRALWHTYLQPASTQEAVAELLGLPFSTYRYHLAGGLERVTAWLWARELHGTSPLALRDPDRPLQ